MRFITVSERGVCFFYGYIQLTCYGCGNVDDPFKAHLLAVHLLISFDLVCNPRVELVLPFESMPGLSAVLNYDGCVAVSRRC